jgi:hypothetical protein
VRLNIASSKLHLGEAICQISIAKPRRYARTRLGRVQWRNNTGTTTRALFWAAGASCRLQGCQSGSPRLKRAPCIAQATARP